jgi:hypothetical protein
VRGQKHCAVFAMLVGLGALLPESAAWAGYDYEQDGGNWGGSVKACSLAGVNPVHHPEIFGNPGVARSMGFVQSRDGVWHVQCSGVGTPAAADNYASTTQKAPGHHRKTPKP